MAISSIADLSILELSLNSIQKNESDIIHFHGRGIYDYFVSKSDITITSKSGNWRKLVDKMNSISQQKNMSESESIRIHNDLKVGDFLQMISGHRKRSNNSNASTTSSLLANLDQLQRPIVMTNSIDENWGFFSTVIVNRTTRWINMTNHLKIHRHSYSSLMEFLNSSKVTSLQSNFSMIKYLIRNDIGNSRFLQHSY